MENYFIKHQQKIGCFIAILNIFAIMHSAWFFFVRAKVNIIVYLLSCSTPVIMFLIGFFSKQKAIMAAAVPLLLLMGGASLFMQGWKGLDLIPQVSHILMVCAAIYTIAVVSIEKIWKKGFWGFIIGLIFLSVFIPLALKYGY